MFFVLIILTCSKIDLSGILSSSRLDSSYKLHIFVCVDLVDLVSHENIGLQSIKYSKKGLVDIIKVSWLKDIGNNWHFYCFM